jgi:hypothetical protein
MQLAGIQLIGWALWPGVRLGARTGDVVLFVGAAMFYIGAYLAPTLVTLVVSCLIGVCLLAFAYLFVGTAIQFESFASAFTWGLLVMAVFANYMLFVLIRRRRETSRRQD